VVLLGREDLAPLFISLFDFGHAHILAPLVPIRNAGYLNSSLRVALPVHLRVAVTADGHCGREW
jgi:hypothetical protein